MKWTEDVNCKTQCGTMASRCSDQRILRCDRTLTADSSIDCDDITVAKNFFLIIVMFVAMMMKETSTDQMTKPCVDFDWSFKEEKEN